MAQNRSAGWPNLLKWTTNAALFVFLLISGFLLLQEDGARAFGSLAYYLLALCLGLLFLLRHFLLTIPLPENRNETGSDAKGEHQ